MTILFINWIRSLSGADGEGGQNYISFFRLYEFYKRPVWRRRQVGEINIFDLPFYELDKKNLWRRREESELYLKTHLWRRREGVEINILDFQYYLTGSLSNTRPTRPALRFLATRWFIVALSPSRAVLRCGMLEPPNTGYRRWPELWLGTRVVLSTEPAELTTPPFSNRVIILVDLGW